MVGGCSDSVLVRLNVADVLPPATLAVTVYGPPAVPLAVAVTPVSPLASVGAGLVRVALAPETGGVKVTVAPLTGLLLLSVTFTTRGAENCVFTKALMVVVGETACTAVAEPTLVSENEGAEATPATV